MAFVSNTGINPLGQDQRIKVDGIVFLRTEPLQANETIITDWFDHEGYIGIDVSISADVPSITGGRILETSVDGENILEHLPGTYPVDNDSTGILKRSFKPSGRYFRYIYTNGPVAQSSFYFLIRLTTSLSQPAMDNIGNDVGDVAFGMITKAVIVAKDETDGRTKQLTQTDGALDVNIVNNNPVTGTVEVDNFPANQNVTITNLPVTQSISGNVGIINFPSNQSVILSGTPTVNANVTFPTTQTISGSVGITGGVEVNNDSGNPLPISGTVSISNFPSSTSISNFPTTQPISGSVSVSNLPSTQVVSGTVGINNFPASQAVTGIFYPATQPVSIVTNTPDVTDRAARLLGHVQVDNFPASQTVSVSNLPTTQAVSGTVTVNNFPASQAVTLSGSPAVSVSFPATQAISAASLPLPSGGSTSALQTTGNTSLASIDSKLTSPLAVSGTFYQATQPVSIASLPLGTGAATSSNQASEIAALGNINDSAVLDPTVSASIIALLKGLLSESVGQASGGTAVAINITTNGTQTIAANANRKGVIISSNNGTIMVGVGFTPTATSWSYRLVTNAIVEIPTQAANLSIIMFASSASTGTATLIV